MKGIKFPKADKTIRKFTKNKKADLAVKVTPSGADRHPRFGSMHHTRCVISIEDSWDGYLFVTRRIQRIVRKLRKCSSLACDS